MALWSYARPNYSVVIQCMLLSAIFCRFELENMSIYEILPALGLTQSVHAEIPPLPKWKRSHDFEQEVVLS
jgi:hypothetical protein